MACSAGIPGCLHTVNRFRYVYAAPVTGVLTCLRLLPRVRHGAQEVISTRIRIDPHPRTARSWTDRFGNCVLEVEHLRLTTHLEVSAEFWTTPASIVNGGCRSTSPEPIRLDSPADALWLFVQPTRLVDGGPEIEALSVDLRRRCASDEALAWEVMHRVYREMRYLPGSTSVETRASDALAHRTGVCQDFAQVMLAICRAAGLPARYVSGHMEGEGQMHAWVEALCAPRNGGPPAWHPLDPTHDRAAVGGYVTVAVGRDYADVSPISGRCYGPLPGHLSSHQHTQRSR
jgi:transglutaminase-like putative cysteine protease